MTMAPQVPDLIEQHLSWIVVADPEAGSEALLRLQPPMPPRRVLPLLAANAPALQSAYLEGALLVALLELLA